MSEVNSKEAVLEFIDGLRKSVEKSVNIIGDIKMEKPSIQPKFQKPLPSTWVGENHLRYTLKLDVLLPHTLPDGDLN